MPDNRTKTGKQDRSRINVNQAHELRYWTKKFKVSADVLRAAVHAVGPMVNDVEAFLRESANS